MEKKVKFRDFHSQEAKDHNNLQEFAQGSMKALVRMGISKTRRYHEFAVTKSGQAEVTIAPGRVIEPDGLVYVRESSIVQSMLGYLAAASKRYVSITAYGNIVETDTETRDKLIDESTGATTPVAVDMTEMKQAVVQITQGAESADPQPPAIPATHVEIARVLLDTTQVVSIEMMTRNATQSTEDLGIRTGTLEDWKGIIEPRVDNLGSDLADLANQVSGTVGRPDLINMKRDLARVVEILNFPDTAVSYGSDYYLVRDEGDDYNNTLALGYDAKVEEGIRFADANADEFAIGLFSPLDPNAKVVNGVLLPAYEEVLFLKNNKLHSTLGVAQYGFQTHEAKVGYMSRSRLRYGGARTICSNGAYYDTRIGAPSLANLYEPERQQLIWSTISANSDFSHIVNRLNYYWYDTWKEPFLYTETTDQTIVGAFVSQTFLISNDMWATGFDIYVAAKGGSENIHFVLSEVKDGQPNLDKSMVHVSYPHANIVTGWNRIAINPTFLQKGKRYAITLISNADHQIGMSYGSDFLDGTFFYSTDGVYHFGDLTKDMLFRVWGARFLQPQVTIEFETINLDGGFRDIDILAHTWVPDSTRLIYEIRPSGTGAWLPLTPENLTALNGAPALAQFRARFVGTRGMQPAIRLTDSRVRVSRPKTVGKHVSSQKTLSSPSSSLTFEVVLENFDEIPHDHTLTIKPAGAAVEVADVTTTTLMDAEAKRYKRVYEFTLASTITQFAIVQDITTNSPANVFHVAELVWWSN